MSTPQPGIFALGSPAHCYLEFELLPGTPALSLVTALAAFEPAGGTNVVCGFRPELWSDVAPTHAPAGVRGFEEDLVGPDGYRMPATQRDGWVWVSGAARDVVFDVAWTVIGALARIAAVRTEVLGWPYHQSRDLTGFIDGTENPSPSEAPAVAVIPGGQPGEGSSVVLVQEWEHDAVRWGDVPVGEQERVIGRTKDDSTELEEEVMPPDSHVARTVVEVDGAELKIYRRNTPIGGVTHHGTMFVGFCATQAVLHLMLERMAGAGDGIRDALTRYTTPLTGAYYVVPSLDALESFMTRI